MPESNIATPTSTPLADRKRIIAHIEGEKEGPIFIFVGGLHGNEPSSVQAMEEVFEEFDALNPDVYGTILALRGNQVAFEKGQRFIEEDLNRIWMPELVDAARITPEEELETVEQRELKRLLEVIDPFLNQTPNRELYFIDLHSFSANEGMFVITSPREKQKKMAAYLNVPIIYGIDEELDGTAIRYLQDQGAIALGFEAGQHFDPKTVYNQKAAIWLLLHGAGLIDKEQIPEFERYAQYFAEQTSVLPNNVRLIYRHIFLPEDNFRMKPGYTNFQRISKGEELASDRNGTIRAKCDGYILMPLYQQQGSDGFFVVEEC